MKTQKLGRGLGALIGEIDEAYENELGQKDSIIEIPLKDIRPNPFQPRKHFEESSLYELSESIKSDGLIQPILVTEDLDGYVLIAGERRLRASKLAKLKSIRSIVLSSDNQKMRQLALIENIQRDELNSIELAYAYGELMKLYGYTHEELSVKINKSRTHITNTIRLLQLSSKTQKTLIERKISTGHAKVLVGLDEKEQQLVVDSIVGQKLSVREVEAMIKSMKSSKTDSLKSTETTSFDLTKFKDIFDILGMKIKTTNRSLTIEFETEAQVLKLLNYLPKNNL
ncbi:ParB/RepB/Spo0J family partition protein [Sulfurimonas sp.]|uniref:ParB/RepB/Spo0J family partition protein n=1 Tax=Sulfurimonas sp. TaxID=2022749 RepID=UPI0025FE7812|nr:ParB/RepB/Spo0J family partition protein [Sulfurimonas sp.]MDD5156528.1 ParB/RepB/Spo0J family partition protein [Sulfurimonas sp.]